MILKNHTPMKEFMSTIKHGKWYLYNHTLWSLKKDKIK